MNAKRHCHSALTALLLAMSAVCTAGDELECTNEIAAQLRDAERLSHDPPPVEDWWASSARRAQVANGRAQLQAHIDLALAEQRERDASVATLTIGSDAACTFSLDGVVQGALSPGHAHQFQVSLGQHHFACRSDSESGIVAEAEWVVDHTDATPQTFQLASRIDDQAQLAAGAARFVALEAGIRDRQLHGVWHSASDAAVAIDEVGDVCSSLGERWTLPTREQLLSLYAAAAAHERPGAHPVTRWPAWSSSLAWTDEWASRLERYVVDMSSGESFPAHDEPAQVLCLLPDPPSRQP